MKIKGNDKEEMEEDIEEEELKSSSSSVEVVSPGSDDNIPPLSQYVQEKMATLGLCPGEDLLRILHV